MTDSPLLDRLVDARLIDADKFDSLRHQLSGLAQLQDQLQRLVDLGEITRGQAAELRAQRSPTYSGRFVLLDPRHDEGLGAIWTGRQLGAVRPVYVKRWTKEKLPEPARWQELGDVVRRAARMADPLLAAVFDVVETETHLLAVMEELPSAGPARWLAETRPAAPAMAAGVAAALAGGLHRIHERQFVHGDLRPANVIVQTDAAGNLRWCKLLNAGSGRLSRTAAMETLQRQPQSAAAMRNVYCIAPEQLDHPERFDEGTDLYSLGWMTFHILSGELPFAGASPLRRAVAQLHERPTPLHKHRPEVSSGWDDLFASWLAPTPEDRPTAEELVERLEELKYEERTGGRAPRKAAAPPVRRDAEAPTLDFPAPAPLGASSKSKIPSSAAADAAASAGSSISKGGGKPAPSPASGDDDDLALVDPDAPKKAAAGGGNAPTPAAGAKAPAPASLDDGFSLAPVDENRPSLLAMMGGGGLGGASPLATGSPLGGGYTLAGQAPAASLGQPASLGTPAAMLGQQPTLGQPAQFGVPAGQNLGAAGYGVQPTLGPQYQAALSAPSAAPQYGTPSQGTPALAGATVGPPSSVSSNTGGGGVARIFQLSQAKTWAGPGRCLAVAPSGKFALVGGQKGAVLWDLEKGKPIRAIPNPKAEVTAVGFSQTDGRTAVVAGQDGQVAVWDLQAGKLQFTLEGHEGPVHCAVTSPNNQWLATGGEDSMIYIWNLSNGEALKILAHGEPVRGLCFSADSNYLLLGGGSTSDFSVRYWNWSLAQELRHFAGHAGPVHAAVLSADGMGAVTASEDHTVRLWDMRSGAAIATLTGHEAPVRTVRLSADARLAFSGGDDGRLRVWDLAKLGPLRSLPGHVGPILDLGIAQNRPLTTGQDETLRFWDRAVGQP